MLSDDKNFNKLVSVIKRVFENMMDKPSIPVNNSEKNNGNNKKVLTMREKIHMAEESYSKFEKPKDMKMYSVYLDLKAKSSVSGMIIGQLGMYYTIKENP